jgi:peptidoglycan/xylan/chitin deacetylase (PgdA/CDA1 family)
MQKTLFFALLFVILALTGIGRTTSNSVLILCYHSFMDNPKNPYNISPSKMSNQMQTIAQWGFKFVTWPEVATGKIKGTKNVLITIDDAHASIKEIMPLFRTYGIKPVLFVYPAIVDRMKNTLTSSDLAALQSEGAVLGAHGWNHLFINKKLYDSDPVAFKREIYYSKKRLAVIAGHEIETFAYPFGIYSDITIEHMSLAGYKYAFTIDKGPQVIPFDKERGPYRIRRTMVTFYSWKGIKELLENGGVELPKK